MIRIFLAILLSFTFATSNTQNHSIVKVTQRVSTVYICNNGQTSVYHVSKNCSAIKRCTHDILEVSEPEAVNKYHLRKCKTCQ
jgi:hypothetical protein